MSGRRRTNKGRNNRRRGPRGPRNEMGMYKAPFVRNMDKNNPVPVRFTTTLSFQANSILRNVGMTFANSYFQPTYMFDVDPLVGSTAVPYFTEFAGMYRYYRLRRFTIHASFANLDMNTAGSVYICPLNATPGVNSLLSQTFLSNPRCKTQIIGGSNGQQNALNLSLSAGVDSFAGVKWSGQIDLYSGQTSGGSPPSNNMYVVVGYVCTPAMGNGVIADVRLSLEVDFFEVPAPAT